MEMEGVSQAELSNRSFFLKKNNIQLQRPQQQQQQNTHIHEEVIDSSEDFSLRTQASHSSGDAGGPHPYVKRFL